MNSKIEVNSYTYGAQNIEIIFKDQFPDFSVKIGKFCSIAKNIKIYAGNGYHDSKNISTYPFGYVEQHIFGVERYVPFVTKGNVIIKNDVWIGDNVTIMSGVTIENGAIIATNSHVTKNVEPYMMVGGNPACVIKPRFEENIINSLLKISWWDWNVDKILQHKDILNSNNFEILKQISSV